jgi:ATP-binding cassette, subfamily F, member 3
MALKQSKNTKYQPAILNVYQFSKAFGVFPVIQNLSFEVNAGEKLALVGVNGAGKSTLLKLIAGQEEPDSGSITFQGSLKVAYLAQEAHFDESRTLYEEMLAAFEELHRLQARLRQLEEKMSLAGQLGDNWDDLLADYATLTGQFELRGGYDYETRIRQVLSGLGFSEEWWPRPLAHFSGGQKTRAALARTLLSKPDLLLLDEPTNHLDLATLEWLEGFLASWPGTIIIISHDRVFLDKVVARVLDLSGGKLADYPGNYSKYLRLRAERFERAAREYQAQQEHIARTEEFIRRFRAGSRAQEAQGRQKLLDRLERVERPKEHSRLRLSLQTSWQSGRVVLATHRLTVGWQTNHDLYPLFDVPDLEIERGERVAIIGPNGSGKTTFLKTVMGEIPALDGRAELGPGVKAAYYAQTHEGLNPEHTILEEIRQTYPFSPEDARTFLGRFLFSNDDVFKQIGQLSGGERSRVALAKITLSKANLLVLDEPTNHLDIQAREALEELLSQYPGTILFVSHDRYLINRLATQLWEVNRAGVVVHRGNYRSFHSEKLMAQAG